MSRSLSMRWVSSGLLALVVACGRTGFEPVVEGATPTDTSPDSRGTSAYGAGSRAEATTGPDAPVPPLDPCPEFESEGPYPRATCRDGVDNDCNGVMDEAEPGCALPEPCATGVQLAWVDPTPVEGSTVIGPVTLALIGRGSTAGLLAANVDAHWTAHWSLVSDSSAVYANAFDSTLQATASGGYVELPDCMVGGCLSFDGITGHARVLDTAALDITGDLTIAAWVRFNDVDGPEQAILGKGHGFAGYTFRINLLEAGSRRLAFKVEDGAQDEFLVRSETLLENDIWYHVAAVRRGDALELYINGVREPEVFSGSSLATNDYDLFIGGDPRGRNPPGVLAYPFNGAIDEVSLHARAWSPEEIASVATPGSEQLSLTLPASVGEQNAVGTFIGADGSVCETPARTFTVE